MLNIKKDLRGFIYDLTHDSGRDDITYRDVFEQFYYEIECNNKNDFVNTILNLNGKLLELEDLYQNAVFDEGYEEKYRIWEEKINYGITSSISEKNGVYTFVLTVIFTSSEPDYDDDGMWTRKEVYGKDRLDVAVIETDDKSEIIKYLGELFDMLGIED